MTLEEIREQLEERAKIYYNTLDEDIKDDFNACGRQSPIIDLMVEFHILEEETHHREQLRESLIMYELWRASGEFMDISVDAFLKGQK